MRALVISEPIDPEHSEPLLECLTPEESDYYPSEDNVLARGDPRDGDFLDIQAQYARIGGERSEYIKY